MQKADQELSEKHLGWLLIAPAGLIILAIAVYPIFDAIQLSFHHIQLQFPELGRAWVGLDNYLDLLRDERFRHACLITVTFTVFTVFFETVFGLGLALLLNKPSAIQGFFRSAALVPWAFTTVVSALLWQFMYDSQYGLVNSVLMDLHVISEPHVWLGSAQTALACAIVADVWKTTPFMALLILAGLQNIPKDMYEAGKIDGTTKVQAFFRLTLPLLRPSILVALLFRTLDAFRVFDLIFVLTQGGPANSTESLSYLTYIKLFREFDFGHGSALSILTFLFVMGLSLVYIKILGTEVKS